MNSQDIRDGFDAAIAHATPEQTARLEVAREYFTNADFRTRLEEATWKINDARRRSAAAIEAVDRGEIDPFEGL